VYKGKKVIVLVPALNEEGKIGQVVARGTLDWIDTLLVIDDGSTDGTADTARAGGAMVMAGNNKDDPNEIPRLLDPICDQAMDLVIGSRYVNGGAAGGDMPVYRKIATRAHPWMMSLFLGKSLTESTNGFRAFRLSLLDDQRINLNQRWLDVYLLWKTVKLGYRHVEVPSTKIYPPRSLGNTKMKPVTGWWSILRPILLLGFGIRQ
jgi:dolichol-phosphate mannosyltransferase